MSLLYRFFERLHQRPLSPWVYPLLPLSWLYGVGVAARLALYRSGMKEGYRMSVPVISIGNLTTGGTGKTPMVIALARFLIGKRLRVVVLSRGYHAKCPQVYARATNPAFGDEAAMIQQSVPEAVVIVGPDRVANAQRAIVEYQPDVILLDDGFQHLRLHRDLNLLLVDGATGFGNGQLLPLGPLREALSQVQRADAVLITKILDSTIAARIARWATRQNKPVLSVPFVHQGLVSAYDRSLSLDAAQVDGQRCYVVCGIARPESLLADLAPYGIPPNQVHVFPDHHVYRLEELPQIWQQDESTVLVTTEKDWVKLRDLLPPVMHARVLLALQQPQLDDDQWMPFLSRLFQHAPHISPENDIPAVAR